jgi:hypothetical protein
MDRSERRHDITDITDQSDIKDIYIYIYDAYEIRDKTLIIRYKENGRAKLTLLLPRKAVPMMMRRFRMMV